MAPIGLPPGFRFHQTDEELVNYYLKRKINGQEIKLYIIPQVNLYKCEPWELAEKSLLLSRDPEWYFFGLRDRKHPNGFRTNRATRASYWKSTGKDRRVTSQNRPIGMKKTLVYYRGRVPQGMRTGWVMHQYRHEDKDCEEAPSIQGSYALCRMFKKNATPSDIGEQVGQHSSAPMENHGRAAVCEYETTLPVAMPSSLCMDEEDKNDSWMQFIMDDGSRYPPNSTPLCGEDDAPQVPIR